MEQTKYDVFISYSRKDTEVANQICAAFDEVGITYFIDKQGIGGGMEFPAILAKAIKESKVFLFLASKNSYESKFTQSEIVYAFNKKQKQDIIPYIIDCSQMPDEQEFIFSAINWRRMEEHLIETVLIDDVLAKVGKCRPPQDGLEPGSDDVDSGDKQPLTLKDKILSIINSFSGKTMAQMCLGCSIFLFLFTIIAPASFIKSNNNFLCILQFLLAFLFFLFPIIGLIRPISMGLSKRKDVVKFYFPAFFVIIITLGITIRHDPLYDSISHSPADSLSTQDSLMIENEPVTEGPKWQGDKSLAP